MTKPITTIQGRFISDPNATSGIRNAGALPYITCATSAPMVEAKITGIKLIRVYSIITTSMAKITPAMGVLNEAEIPAAVPQATNTRKLLLGSRSFSPNPLEAAAPK